MTTVSHRAWAETQQRQNFAFETTLASRTFMPRITEWMQAGYAFHLTKEAHMGAASARRDGPSFYRLNLQPRYNED